MVKVTRSKPNNSFGHAKFVYGISVKRDVCDTKKWAVTSWKKTYFPRFDSEFKANVWLWKNFHWIAEEHTLSYMVK